jgi:integrase
MRVRGVYETFGLNACETLAEKLMMRMGFEVGLRTSELMGLRISGEKGLLKLIEQLDDNDFSHVNQFGYWLQGRYTKGSKSRWIYFDRLLLQDMKRYVQTERQWLIDQTGSIDDSFFLRIDQRFIGTGIGEEQGSRVFRKRAKSAGMNPLLHFHDLRHTFATELFHAELAGPDGRETRSESAALIVVAQRLHSHAVTTAGDGGNGEWMTSITSLKV